MRGFETDYIKNAVTGPNPSNPSPAPSDASPGPGSPTRAGRPYLPQLDALRTVAAILVIFAHVRFATTTGRYSFFHQTGAAVDFFFVLSGFVIALNYWGMAGVSTVGRFLQARFARIYPLHLLTLLCFLALECLKLLAERRFGMTANQPAFSENNATAFILNLLLLNAHGMTRIPTFNFPSWSIGAEASCYLLFALTHLFFKSVRIRLAAFGALAAGAAFFLPVSANPASGLPRAVVGFLAGCLLWLVLKPELASSAPAPAGGSKTRHACFNLGFGIAGLFGAWLVSVHQLQAGMLMIAPAIVGFCALNGSSSYLAGLRRIGSSWFGKISYGVYLWHALLIWVANRVLTLLLHHPSVETKDGSFVNCPEHVGDATLGIVMIASLALGQVSFRWFEQPWRKRLAPR